MSHPPVPAEPVDLLVVGAGPTGLTLAAELLAFGVTPRIVDAAPDRVHESRALPVQPRTLEVLRPLGLDGALVERGNAGVGLRMTAGRRVARVPLFDIGAEDTAFPFLLFVSQAETEAVLGDHLSSRGVGVERSTAFESSRPVDGGLACTLRRPDGTREVVRARYLVGCDGVGSTVREQAGIAFRGGRYPQTFLLADLAADGLEPGAVNAHLGPDGPLFFSPLVSPAPWRLITMRPPGASGAVTTAELQAVTDRRTGGGVRLGRPVWCSAFRIQHRVADRYRSGSVFLAGDAAHVHSPAGAQGMNTGIQDAVDLGWRLGLVCRGAAPDTLLDSYDAERRPVGQFVLRFTDQAFTVVTSTHPVVRAARTHLAPLLLPRVLRWAPGRAYAFRTISQLGIRYRRSPDVRPSRRRVNGGPRPGDRLPDARVARAGAELWLQQALSAPGFHLLVCGPRTSRDDAAPADLRARFAPWLSVHHLATGGSARPGDLVDVSGQAISRLRVRRRAVLLVRPDGHIACRDDDGELAGVAAHLQRWLVPDGAP